MATTVTNKNGIEFDIDALATDVNGKMDRDGVNATCPVVISRTPNSQGGVVEIWSDGYCVQTGIVAKNSDSITVTFNQSYNNNKYLVTISQSWYGHQQGGLGSENIYQKELSYLNIYSTNKASDYYIHYRTEGYIR